jgi:hypothetical protein
VTVRHPVAALLVLAALFLGVLLVVHLLAKRREMDGSDLAHQGLGQRHMLVSIHKRRQPSFQLMWNAPDGATGYTVYVASNCAPASAGAADAGAADAGAAAIYCPGEVSVCSSLHTTTNYNSDAGTCACNGDGGLIRGCSIGPITAAAIANGGCANPALCCVTYPGAPAPAGQHDGIVVSACYKTHADGGAVVDAAGGGSLYVETGYYFDVEAH